MRVNEVTVSGQEEEMAAGQRHFPNNFLTRLHGAFSTSVAPPRLEINRKTIEKTWKLMDKVHINILDDCCSISQCSCPICV